MTLTTRSGLILRNPKKGDIASGDRNIRINGIQNMAVEQGGYVYIAIGFS